MDINENIPNLSMLYKDGSVYVTQKAIDRDDPIKIPQEIWSSGIPYPSNPSWIKCELPNYFKVDNDGFFYLTEADIYYHEFKLSGHIDSTQSHHDHPYHKFVLQFDFKIPSNPKDKYVLFFSDSYNRINPYDAYYLEKVSNNTWKISHQYRNRNGNSSYPIVEGEEIILKPDNIYRFKRVIYCGTDTDSIQVIKAYMNGKQVVRDITDFWGRGTISFCDNFKAFVYNDRGLYLPCLKYNNVFITDAYVDYMGDDEWLYQEDSRKLSLTITSDKSNPIDYGDTVNLTTTVIDSLYQSDPINSIISPTDFNTGDDTFNLPICNLANPYGEVLETKSIYCGISSYYGGNWVEFPLIEDGSIYSGLRGIKTWSTQERSYNLIIKDNTNKDTLGCSNFSKYSHFIVEYAFKLTDSYSVIPLGSFKLENPNDGSNLECLIINNKGELLDDYSNILNSKIPYIERDKWYRVKFDFSLDTPTKDNVDVFYSTLNLYINDTPIYTHTYERNIGNLAGGLVPQISWCTIDPKNRSYPGIIVDLHITRILRELPEYKYIWSTDETTPNITVDKSSTYTCKVYIDNSINAIDFINIIYNEEFKNEYKPALPPYSKGHYLVCYKGNSILDKLIKIVKKHSPFFQDPNKELNQEIEQLYTHVGILILPEDINDLPKEVTYLACREDAGVMEYTEPRKDIDVYKINLKTVDTEVIEYFFNRTQYLHGSMITDMGYRHLAHPGTLGSVDWVAMALNLAFPKKYTITRLIEFSQLEE